MIVGFRPDGKSLLAMRPWEMPARVETVELATGQRTLFREIAPQNMVGAITLCGIDFSSDEESYAYSIARSVGTLYFVEGVR